MGQVGTRTPEPAILYLAGLPCVHGRLESAVGDRGKEYQAEDAAKDEKTRTQATGRGGNQEVHAQHTVDPHAKWKLQKHDCDDHVAGIFGGTVENDPGIPGQ